MLNLSLPPWLLPLLVVNTHVHAAADLMLTINIPGACVIVRCSDRAWMWYRCKFARHMRNYWRLLHSANGNEIVVSQLLTNLMAELNGNVIPRDSTVVNACAELSIKDSVYVPCRQIRIVSKKGVDCLIDFRKPCPGILKLQQFLDGENLTALMDGLVLVIDNEIAVRISFLPRYTRLTPNFFFIAAASSSLLADRLRYFSIIALSCRLRFSSALFSLSACCIIMLTLMVPISSPPR